jgi:hypothetical protein
MNYNNFTQETSRMVELMKYGMNESASKSSAPRVEYSVKAADGLTYGIVNEGTKFYIKVAPKKDTAILNEDFDYIGGEMNKKENEYKSYGAASKNLELKLMQINESHKNAEKVIVEASKKAPAADWQINETVEMRNAINRMNQISRNVGYILTEGAIPSEHTLPEAPAKNPSQEKVNGPFTDTAVAKGDKDFTDTETNYEKPSGTPYSKATNAKLTSDKKPRMSGDNGNAYTDKAQFAPKGAVANEHPTGGKVTRADESRRTIKLTEEQVLAWNRNNDNYMDKSNGTQIGSSAPFSDELDCKTSNQCADTEPIHEAEGPVHNSDTTLYPNGSTGEPAHDGDPFIVSKDSNKEAKNGVIAESDFDDEDIAGFEGFDDEEDVPFPEVEGDEYELELDDDDEGKESAYDDMEADGLFDDDDYEEDYHSDPMYEATLHDFGKHPAYRKAPMTLPPNKEVAPNDARDWNDESAEGEEPFGTKIGSSAPFEKAVQRITNSIMESLGF